MSELSSAVVIERRDFKALEKQVNGLLEEACRQLLSDPARCEHFARLFDRSTETGFYARPDGPRGAGEQPTWSPNPAYMDSLEEIWIPVADLLEREGLAIEKTLRELFYLSSEYQDRASDHRRIFHGHLVDHEHHRPVTYFMLNIPHSHAGFRYLKPPRIHIAESL